MIALLAMFCAWQACTIEWSAGLEFSIGWEDGSYPLLACEMLMGYFRPRFQAAPGERAFQLGSSLE
jgi:hypothetical protein